MDYPTIRAALATYTEATAAMADADRALNAAAPAYIVRALTYKGARPGDRDRLAAVVPYLPDTAPLPVTLSPHTVNAAAFLEYEIPADCHDWGGAVLELRQRHPAIPVAIVKDSCTSIRPASVPVKERATVEECADFAVTADAPSGDYEHAVSVTWWTEPAPGIVLEIRVQLEPWGARRMVRYTLDNPPRNHGRQHPEDRRWSVSWSWGGGSRSIKWWTSPGNKPRMTWTWPVGTDIGHALTVPA